MTTEADDWYVELIMKRQEALELTYEQAQKVHLFEKEKDQLSGPNHLSTWEDWDYEATVYRQILSETQFEVYKKISEERLEGFQQMLVQDDNAIINDITYNKELISYYVNTMLPVFQRDPFLRFGWLFEERPKIEYLKKVYRQYLLQTKQKFLRDHFRHNKTFKPNQLAVTMLRLDTMHVLPSYGLFRDESDEPTKAIATWLEMKVRRLPDESEKLVSEQFAASAAFAAEKYRQYHGEIKGWHVVMEPMDPEKQRVERHMVMLLLDDDSYGYKSAR